MKQKFTPLLITLLFQLITFNAISQVKIGIRTGFNYPMVKGENYWSKGLYKPQYIFKNDLFNHAGIVVEIPVFKMLSVQPEILYSTSGYSWYSPVQ